MSDVTIRPIDLDRDAESLAVMWNESDLQWPGGWTDGVPMTAEWVRRFENGQRNLVTFVAEVDDTIVGYCSFQDGHHGHHGEGYLALLNVHPGYQKRSIGRRLIQATIERSIQAKFQRQTLGTWSANFKAVPTYKKTGHFWTPETSVWMQNFIPGALQMPLAKPFFEKHDWYACYVRELAQAWDDERWEGLKVFTQRWEADGEALTIWIDREARAPVAVETDDVQVAAIAEEIEPLTGSEVTLRWRVVNKGSEPLRVYVHAVGDKGLSIDHRVRFDVAPGETVERSAPVKVAGDASGRKEDGTAPAVRSLIQLNDREVELFSGLRVKKAFSLDTAPDSLTVAPGVRTAVALQLHNARKQPTEATVRLTPPEGLEVSWREQRVTVLAEGHVAVPLEVTASDEAVYVLPAWIGFTGEGAPEPMDESLTLFSLGAGGLLAQRSGGSVRLETDALRVTVDADGGAIKVEEKAARRTMVSVLPRIGPPYYPGEFDKVTFDLELEQRGPRAVVRMTGAARYSKGLCLWQELTLSPTGLGVLRSRVENRGGETRTVAIQLQVRDADRDEETVAAALPQGIVHAVGWDLPASWADLPRDTSAYAEPWYAWERDGAVGGFAWGEGYTTLDAGWGMSVTTSAMAVAPGDRSPEARVALWAGRGDWRDVRRVALAWTGHAPETAEPAARPAAMARLVPGVIATVDDEVAARLVVDTTHARVDDGVVTVDGDGLTADPCRVVLHGFSKDTPREQPLRLSLPARAPGTYAGSVWLSMPLFEHRAPFTVLRLGTGGGVAVWSEERAGQTVWSLDNGLSRFEVAPGHGASVIGWYLGDGGNQLCSYFPQPRGFSWLYPWFGGIHPEVMPDGWNAWEGALYREAAVTAQPLEVVVAGLIWRGVRLTVQPAQEKLKGLGIEIDYATLGGSNVLRQVTRLYNLRGCEQVARAGSRVTAALGADPTALTILGEGVCRRPTNASTWTGKHRWAALRNDATGRTLLMASRSNDLLLWDAGQHGRALDGTHTMRLAANETQEIAHYLVLAESWEGAQGYRALCDLEE